jgi:hypothetical protein
MRHAPTRSFIFALLEHIWVVATEDTQASATAIRWLGATIIPELHMAPSDIISGGPGTADKAGIDKVEVFTIV